MSEMEVDEENKTRVFLPGVTFSVVELLYRSQMHQRHGQCYSYISMLVETA